MKTLQKLFSLFLVLALLFSLSTAVFAADAPADTEAGSDAESGSSDSWIVVLLIVLGGILILGAALLLIVKKFSDAN